MTTSDARKRLAESIDRLERYATRTHSIDPDTGEFTRLDQEDTMTDLPRTVITLTGDRGPLHVAKGVLVNGSPVTVAEHGVDIDFGPDEVTTVTLRLLADEVHFVKEAPTEIRDRLPERETKPEGITCMTCGASLVAGDPLDCRLHADGITEEPPVGYQVTDRDGDVWERRESGWRLRSDGGQPYSGVMDHEWGDVREEAPLRLTTEADRERVGLPVDTAPAEPLEWLPEPVPVPHPDEALAEALWAADSNGHFSWEGTGLETRADYLRMARAARQYIDAERDEADERVAAWHEISGHPIFLACYPEERPLINSMMDRLARAEQAEADLARVTKENRALRMQVEGQ